MTKIRECDRCKQKIDSKQSYLKVCLAAWTEKKYTLNHKGDLCLECWGNILS